MDIFFFFLLKIPNGDSVLFIPYTPHSTPVLDILFLLMLLQKGLLSQKVSLYRVCNDNEVSYLIPSYNVTGGTSVVSQITNFCTSIVSACKCVKCTHT